MGEPTADETAVSEWATAHKISAECVKLLFKDGFTSMEAVALVEKEDLSPKIPRGQHRLILQAVAALKKAGQRKDGHPQVEAPPSPNQGTRPTTSISEESDPYIAAITSQLQAAQAGETTPNSQESEQPAYCNMQPTPATAASQQPASKLSWNDPQVFIKMAAGKAGTATYYDITDFANLATSAVREEIVGNGTSGAQLVWRTGPRKPKLSSLTIPQWSVANLAILSRLQEEGKLAGDGPHGLPLLHHAHLPALPALQGGLCLLL